jgi:hypothetical protein
MPWKTTLALLVATFGVGAYITLYEIKQPPPEERQALARQVLDLAPEAVTQVLIERPAAPAGRSTVEPPAAPEHPARPEETAAREDAPAPQEASAAGEASAGRAQMTLRREEARWRLEPDGWRADEASVGRLLDQVNPLTAERILEGSAERRLSPADFGLAPAAVSVTFQTEAGPTTLLIGDSTPVGSHRYVQVAGRPQIYVVPSDLFDVATQPVEAFRDSLLARVATWSANDVAVTSEPSSFTLARRDTRWELTQPVTDWADRSAVNALLSRLSNLRIQRFLEAGAASAVAAALGLEPPQTTVTLTVPEETGPVRLLFGTPLPDDASLIYAQRGEEPHLYAVSADDLEAILLDPNELRSTVCVEFFTSLVSRVQVRHAGSEWTIERAGGDWREADSGTPLEAERVETFLSQLADLRLEGFVEEAPTDLARYGLAEAASADTAASDATSATTAPSDATPTEAAPPAAAQSTTEAGTADHAPEAVPADDAEAAHRSTEAGSPPPSVIAVWTTDHDTPQRLFIGSALEGSGDRYGLIEGRHVVVRLPEQLNELLATTPETLRVPEASAATSPAPL